MKVEVDLKICEANAICMGILPEVFDLDDDDRLHILNPDVTADNESAVRDAVAQCPRAALTITE
ncbi:ferredoxin [Nocardia bovistercoris]|uniref:Ferredoxin n=1 Tax=Nocardia bovistercoris TaxID=2785916 RepID=A0A931N6M2_9NOCA|nr:ferredoxin [Nocardia bovistercoris]MBH0781114.1 ferredoxin [Nocardia bovistercoris]